jgi:outer membrane protein OmpU
MKKLLMTGAAFVALATTPAMAQGLTLDVAGHFKGYGVYNDNDEAAGVSLDSTNIRKETEIHFTGETTLDSGLTVGVHVETNTDRDDFTLEESYMYLSGGWGRINFGEEDGAAYLLQVAAPSADSNVDGLRQYISTFNATGNAAGALAANTLRLDYDHVAVGSGYYNKFTYMTPVFNGFQAGFSYIPTMSDDGNALTPVAGDEDLADYEDGWELAARYEGAFEGVGVAFGAGYGNYDAETTNATDAVSDDATTWNAGLDLDFAGFGLGVAYLDQQTEAANVETDTTTMVIGADYQMGAYKLGLSYYDQEIDVANVAGDTETDRWTAGVNYAYGPGMSFRGSVSMIDRDPAGAGGNIDSTQVTVGTQVNF